MRCRDRFVRRPDFAAHGIDRSRGVFQKQNVFPFRTPNGDFQPLQLIARAKQIRGCLVVAFGCLGIQDGDSLQDLGADAIQIGNLLRDRCSACDYFGELGDAFLQFGALGFGECGNEVHGFGELRNWAKSVEAARRRSATLSAATPKPSRSD